MSYLQISIAGNSLPGDFGSGIGLWSRCRMPQTMALCRKNIGNDTSAASDKLRMLGKTAL
ncbi:hypothetical protein SAMN04487914_11334 [Arthrobacter sp. ok909]|nr:hypothetical protein SAMN04487914_11334 [Arthrobacter sp. ok909]